MLDWMVRIPIYFCFVLFLVKITDNQHLLLGHFRLYCFVNQQKLYVEWDEYISIMIIGTSRRLAPAVDVGNYSMFARTLLEWQRTLGVGASAGLGKLRKLMRSEMNILIKQKQLVNQTLIQKLMVMGIVWGMVAAFRYLIGIELQSSLLIGMLAWQLIGLTVFLLVISKLRDFYFLSFDSFFISLNKLSLLHEFSMPYAQMINRAGVNDLILKGSRLRTFHELMMNALRKHRELGVCIASDLNLLKSECELLRGDLNDQFTKTLSLLKFAFLVFFQVLCYFFFLYQIGNSFLLEHLK
jgi:hypothetical protein